MRIISPSEDTVNIADPTPPSARKTRAANKFPANAQAAVDTRDDHSPLM